MGFWNTFVKVWEVRTSIEIQDSINNLFRSKRKTKRRSENHFEIIEEIYEKNKSWNENIDEQREKTKK